MTGPADIKAFFTMKARGIMKSGNTFTQGTFTVILQQSAKQETVNMLSQFFPAGETIPDIMRF